VTVPAQRVRRDVPRTRKVTVARTPRAVPTPPNAPVARSAGADVAGHGLLSRFHSGCRCPWCTCQAREHACPCAPCFPPSGRTATSCYPLAGARERGLANLEPPAGRRRMLPDSTPTAGRFHSGVQRATRPLLSSPTTGTG